MCFRILILVKSLELGGTEKSAVKLALNLKQIPNYQIYFATLGQSKHDFYESPTSNNLSFFVNYNFNVKKLTIKNKINAFINFIYDFYQMRKIIKLHGINLVISFGAGVGCLTYLVLLFLDIAQITSERTTPDSNVYKPSLLARLLRPWIYKHGVLCSVQTEGIQKLTKNLWNIESYLTPNFFEITQSTYSGSKVNAPCISIGRMTEAKGYELLLESWSLVEKQISNPLILVCEDKNNSLKNLIQKHNLQNVKIFSVTKNIYDLFDNSIIYISTSTFEGYPNAIAEAMLFGLPVLTTNSSDIVNCWIQNELCIELLSRDPYYISTSIVQLVRDSGLREKISQNSISKRGEFTWSTIGVQWLNLIEFALKKPKK